MGQRTDESILVVLDCLRGLRPLIIHGLKAKGKVTTLSNLVLLLPINETTLQVKDMVCGMSHQSSTLAIRSLSTNQGVAVFIAPSRPYSISLLHGSVVILAKKERE